MQTVGSISLRIHISISAFWSSSRSKPMSRAYRFFSSLVYFAFGFIYFSSGWIFSLFCICVRRNSQTSLDSFPEWPALSYCWFSLIFLAFFFSRLKLWVNSIACFLRIRPFLSILVNLFFLPDFERPLAQFLAICFVPVFFPFLAPTSSPDVLPRAWFLVVTSRSPLFNLCNLLFFHLLR